jgi:hypothetical protein
MDLIKPPNEYIVIHNDLSVNTISHSPHIRPISCNNVPSIESVQPKVRTGYRSTLTTPDGKPLFNCLLQHNPEPVYSHQRQHQMTESQKKLAEEKRNLIMLKRREH